MFDAVSRSDAPARQRAIGALRIGFKRRGTATVLDTLYQQGCLKARLPAVEAGAWPGAVTLNSSGGVAGGDRLDTAVTLAAGCHASVSAQAAERFYRAHPDSGPAVLRSQVTLGAGARMEWLPQETILFDRCALDRRLDVEMAEDASFLGLEMLVFGRLAMGETIRAASLRDVIRLRRGGRLIWHDAIRMEGDIDALLGRPAVGNGARALATIVYVGADTGVRLDAVRTIGIGDGAAETDMPDGDDAQTFIGAGLAAGIPPPVMAGDDPPSVIATRIAASCWDGMLVTRVLAPSGASLRAIVTLVLGALRDGRPLPRVWLC